MIDDKFKQIKKNMDDHLNSIKIQIKQNIQSKIECLELKDSSEYPGGISGVFYKILIFIVVEFDIEINGFRIY